MGLVQSMTRSLKSVKNPKVRDIVWSGIGWLQTFREFAVDASDYLRDSAYRPERSRTIAHRERDLMFSYHQVEKGLTFPRTKRPFGAKAASSITQGVSSTDFSRMKPAVMNGAVHAHEALVTWNSVGTYDDRVAPRAEFRPTLVSHADDVSEFFSTRWSCRDYDMDRRISVEDIRSVVRLAQAAPSVCNRQSARIQILEDLSLKAKALALQNGNRGFGDSIPHLAVVTVDRRYFKDAGERNQRWVDGGLFAMTFVWALHARGYASCMLNWSLGVTATKALRRELGLSPHEDVICLIAFGHAAAGARAARSERIALDEILTIRGPAL